MHHRDGCFSAVFPSGVKPVGEEEYRIEHPFHIRPPEVDVVSPASGDDLPLQLGEIFQCGPTMVSHHCFF